MPELEVALLKLVVGYLLIYLLKAFLWDVRKFQLSASAWSTAQGRRRRW